MAIRATAPKIAVFGVPSAAGALAAGTERAPFALREAGLLGALAEGGARVVNLSDLSLFPWRDDAEHPRARNQALTACAARATADEMLRALSEGFTVVLGGDCAILPGTMAGARQALGRDVGLVYLDANADLNTPETSPSGRLAGMALALALGQSPETLTMTAPPVRSRQVALLGYRAVDPGERAALASLALAVSAHDLRLQGCSYLAGEALASLEGGEGPVLVHLDVAVLDPAVMPAKAGSIVGPGLNWGELEEMLLVLCTSPRVIALEVCGFDPSRDAEGQHAQRLVAAIAAAARARLGS
jgi:arginase